MGVAVALSLGAPTPVAAKRGKKGPTQVVPPKKKPKTKGGDEDLSKNGSRRGITEIVLGAVTGAAGLALVGRGIWEVSVGRRVKRQCENFEITDTACNRENPGNGGFIAAGLSFGLVVPLGVASGLLLWRGTKINRAYKQFKAKQTAVGVSANARGAAVSLSFRF
ncbi:MAG: hypothetical protein AAF721_39790 [Myxococcota bacterium]